MSIKQLKWFCLSVLLIGNLQLIQAQGGLVINEVSQGTSGGEWVELVVEGACTVDIRGWIIDDNNGLFTDCGAGNPENGAFSGHGVATGHLRFSNDATWAAVPEGTIIVVYANGALPSPLPTGEAASVGDPTDSNCDLIRWCPMNASNTYMTECGTAPSSAGPGNCNCATNGPGGNSSYVGPQLPLNATSWNKASLNNSGDVMQIRDDGGVYYHGFAYGNPTGCGGTTSFTGGPDNLYFATNGGGICYQFLNTIDDDFRNINNFLAQNASANESPGFANNCANAQWIADMRYPPEDFFYPTCSPATQIADICVGQTATITVPITTCIGSEWGFVSATVGIPPVIIPDPTSIDIVNGTIDVFGLLQGTASVVLSATFDNSGIFNGAGCPLSLSTSEVEITVNVGAGPTANAFNVTECAGPGGTTTFDLTTYDNIVNGGSGDDVEWFLDNNNPPTTPVPNPTSYVASVGSNTVYAVVIEGLCQSAPVPIQFIITPLPAAIPAAITDCTIQGSTQAQVNLNSLNNQITNNTPSNTVTYYEDAGANIQINTPSSYIVGVGTTTVYAVVDDGSCESAPVPVVITIFQSPNLVPTGVATLCEGDMIDLNTLVTETSGSNPVILFYNGSNCSGTPISANQTPPLGTNTYCVEAVSGICTNEVQVIVIVTPGDVPILASDTICESDSPLDLTTLQDPVFPNGTWTGPGVSGTTFDPTGQLGTNTLTFTPDGCGSAASTTVEVVSGAVPNLTSATVCSTDGDLNLNSLLDPLYPNGTWSGDYVTDTIFDPSQVMGDETVTVTFTSSDACVSPTTTTIDVTLALTPILGNATVCSSDTLLDLTTLEDPTYPGGTWTGTGVNGTEFDPSGLSGTITLDYTPNESCTNNATTDITVETTVTPTLGTTDICNAETAYDLTLLEDTNYPGGTWIGPGVTGSDLDASAQSGSVTLQYIAVENCTDTANTTINLIEAPIVSNIVEACDGTNTTYTVSFDISLGDTSTYTVNGVLVNGTSFVSAPIPAGTPYTFVVDDTNSCDPTTLMGSFDCNCTTQAGTIDFSNPIVLCDSSDIDVTALYNNDFVSDGDDLEGFIIHDSQTASLGNVLGQSSSAVIPYPAGVIPNTTYYISPIAGDDNGMGMVNLSDPCFSITQGVAITFTSPDLAFTVPNEFCEDDCIEVNVVVNNTDVSAANPVTIDYEVFNGTTSIPGSITIEGDSLIEICEHTDFTTGFDLIFNSSSIAGCSIDYGTSETYGLDILLSSEIFIADTLCSGGFIVVAGVTFDETIPSGQINLAGLASNGCDSIVNIDLTFIQPDTNFLHQTLCEGTSIDVNGTTYDELNPTGFETIPNGSITGCDSLIDVQLTFVTAVTNPIDSTLCPGDSILVNGVSYNENNPTGIDTIINGSFLGCDSIIQVDLSFFAPVITTIDSTLCTDGSVLVNNVVYDINNPTGTEVLLSTQGCDSTVHVNLNFFPEASTTLDPTICLTDTLFVNGTAYFNANPSGTETLSGASQNGCDSIINIDLSFFPEISFTLDDTICSTSSILVNGTTYDFSNPSGTETFAGAGLNGCDSIVQVDLTFFPVASGIFEQTLCPGESINVGGSIFDETTPTGTVTLPGAAVNGCDSIIDVTIDFFNVTPGIEVLTICPGGSATYNGTVYDESNPTGSELLLGADINGCDSIVNVSISVLDEGVFDLIETICTTESMTVNGTIYDVNNSTGTEVLTGAAINGCDSIINVTLDFFVEVIEDETYQLCSDESIEINGTTYDINNQAGTEVFVGASVNGCDSTVNVQIDILPDATGNFETTLCEDESIEINGTTYDISNPTGQEILADAASNGCDSIVDISIDFFPTAVGFVTDEIPAAGSIIVNGTTYDINNPSGQEILINASINGCDSIVNVNLSFIPETVFFITVIEPTCFGEEDGEIIIDSISNATLPIALTLVGPGGIPIVEEIVSFPHSIIPASAGSYALGIVDALGAISSTLVQVDNPPIFEISGGGLYNVDLGYALSLQITGVDIDSVIWSPSTFLNCDTCTQVISTPEMDMNYDVIAFNSLGCESTAAFLVQVNPVKDVYIPNIISPDFDGVNDVFTIYAGPSVRQIQVLQIFDRWGDFLFEAKDFPPNDLTYGWDGSFLGRQMENGVYVFYTIVEFLNGETQVYKGEITIAK